MINRKFTNEEVYGVSDEFYANSFKGMELSNVIKRYEKDLELLQKNYECVRLHYCNHKNYDYLKNLSIADIENLAEVVKRKIASVKISIDKYEKLKSISKEK